MRHFQAAALAIDLYPWIRAIELDVLDKGARIDENLAAPALPFDALQHVLLRLYIPGVVVLPSLNHGARGGGRISSPFQLHGVEEGPVGHVVVRIDLIEDHVPRLEVEDSIRSCAHGLEVV